MALDCHRPNISVKELLDIMSGDMISKPEKIEQLKSELAAFFDQPRFLKADTMGQIVKLQMKQMLLQSLSLIPKTNFRVAD